MNTAVGLVADVVITFGLLYVFVLTVMGIRQTGNGGIPLAVQESLMDGPVELDSDLGGFTFWFLIAALNEEEVIGATIEALLRDQAGAAVVVVDDGSDDRTAAIVESFHDDRVILHRRRLPDARLGKGEALNAGLALIRNQVAAAGGGAGAADGNGR